jgi:hypothetical protein
MVYLNWKIGGLVDWKIQNANARNPRSLRDLLAFDHLDRRVGLEREAAAAG